MANVIVLIAVIVSPDIVRILREQNAGGGIQVERIEPGIRHLVERMAVNVIDAELEPMRHRLSNAQDQAGVVRDGACLVLSYRLEPSIGLEVRQANETSAEPVQAIVLDDLVVTAVPH